MKAGSSPRTMAQTLTPLRVALLSAGLLLLALPLPGEAAPTHKLVGKWQAEAMVSGGKRYPVKPPTTIVFEYQRGGKLVITIKLKDEAKVQKGTWKVEGKQLTMSADGKTEKMTFSITGTKLRIDKTVANISMTYLMKRIP